MPQKIHFVTGRLAESALRRELEDLHAKAGFEYTIQVLPITVAALLTPKWIAPRLVVPEGTDFVLLPGYCAGDLSPIQQTTSVSIQIGPKDLRDLPAYFGQEKVNENFGRHDIEIIAEINHAPRQSIDSTIAQAKALIADGADFIDVGCDPGETWQDVGHCVTELLALGTKVSVDSFNPKEVELATKAGAQLVLSVNSSNVQFAPDWGCEVIVVPDNPAQWTAMESTLEFLTKSNVPFRVDPILEPIGCGFAQSLERYMAARKRWPDCEMMMGIGNITELTDVDSAGINLLLLAICQELAIRSVLTTQVINWASSSVAECDIARQMVHFAIQENIPPKHVSEELVVLRDPKIREYGLEELAKLAGQIKDKNYRIFAENGILHLIGGGHHLQGTDPFDIFDTLSDLNPGNLDPSHAFYLGYELCKALTANTLGKQYTQDEALNWGHLTEPETNRHRLKKRYRPSSKHTDQ